MDKRYQVFISSTYTDLKEERQAITQTLMEMDCIPAGMELFPAADEEQWEFIKRIIEDSDYYLLIIGGRYGSVTKEGISYTEKEYDYAVDKNIPVIALLHENPQALPASNVELSEELRTKLNQFRERVSTGRLVKFWNNASELKGMVALSLTKSIKIFPAIGWVRADKTSNEELLNDLNSLRKANNDLISQLKENKKESSVNIDIEDLAGLEDEFEIDGIYLDIFENEEKFNIKTTWAKIFGLIAPMLIRGAKSYSIRPKFSRVLLKDAQYEYSLAEVSEYCFETITFQLQALNLINVEYYQDYEKWSLTEHGKAIMYEIRLVRKPVANEENNLLGFF